MKFAKPSDETCRHRASGERYFNRESLESAERRLRNMLLVLCAMYGTPPEGLSDLTVSCGIMNGCMPAGDGICGPTLRHWDISLLIHLAHAKVNLSVSGHRVPVMLGLRDCSRNPLSRYNLQIFPTFHQSPVWCIG